VGGLIYDPALYQSLRRIAGGLDRSAILRALVRYAIKKGEQAQPPAGPDGPQRVRGVEPADRSRDH
jgi:hypothetical protein